MEIADWDSGSVILHGLSAAVKPSHVREMVEKGVVTPASENMIRPLLKQMVVYLYNHQKTSPVYQANVSNGKNTLAYFLCAVHQQPPDQKGKKRDRPKLRTAKQLPLADWESLYYALVAEIRSLYSDLQERYGNDFGGANIILHRFGENGTSNGNQPFTALRLAAELEKFWQELMDHRLIAAIDKAVREKQVREASSKHGQSDNAAEQPTRTADSEGLMDVSEMTPNDIMEILWSRHAPEIERRARETEKNQTLLAACRAEVREAGSRSSSESARSQNIHCKCNVECECRLDCNFQTNECACAHIRNQVQELVNDNLKLSKGVRHGLGPSVAFPEHLFGAMMNDMAQMLVAAQATSDPYTIQAAHQANQEAAKRDAQVLRSQRQRANTADSDLAYVPRPRTPSRGNKDAYPLGFYGDHSGGRYPNIRPQQQNNPPPVYGASAYSNQIPTRKPVPAPITAPIMPPSTSVSSRRQQVPTPDSSPLDAQSFAQAGQITYPSIPVSQSQNVFTQSFPAPTAGNVREQADTDTSVTAQTYLSLAEETHDAILPYNDEPSTYPTQPQANSADSLPSTSPPSTVPVPKTREDTLSPSKSYPPLPVPHFIAPRPALKQRYVSAGGTAKLCDRAEIPAPIVSAPDSGAAIISKEELFAALSDPEVMRMAFSNEDSNALTSIEGERNSEDVGGDFKHRSERSSSGIRSSDEGGLMMARAAKRERTESSTSVGSGGRFAKLKRVFSRKNSASEGS